ncbi:uncharacterized protein LOC143230996 isoform X3 [Tachypleus tridentatus]|uniref:uncharacterized protein LOC143230996 isoform X3 n=1 Tax=Tachypleus tridentatus TaxID=6853 RepID=UPI003FD306A4
MFLILVTSHSKPVKRMWVTQVNVFCNLHWTAVFLERLPDDHDEISLFPYKVEWMEYYLYHRFISWSLHWFNVLEYMEYRVTQVNVFCNLHWTAVFLERLPDDHDEISLFPYKVEWMEYNLYHRFISWSLHWFKVLEYMEYRVTQVNVFCNLHWTAVFLGRLPDDHDEISLFPYKVEWMEYYLYHRFISWSLHWFNVLEYMEYRS